MLSPERAADLYADLKRALELYISECLRMAVVAEHNNDNRDRWNDEAARANQNMQRILGNVELMLRFAAGDFVQEIDGGNGHGNTYNIGGDNINVSGSGVAATRGGVAGGGVAVGRDVAGDVVAADVKGSSNVQVGKDAKQDIKEK